MGGYRPQKPEGPKGTKDLVLIVGKSHRFGGRASSVNTWPSCSTEGPQRGPPAGRPPFSWGGTLGGAESERGMLVDQEQVVKRGALGLSEHLGLRSAHQKG